MFDTYVSCKCISFLECNYQKKHFLTLLKSWLNDGFTRAKYPKFRISFLCKAH